MAKLTDDMLRFIIDLDASGAQGKINTLTVDISKLERENQSLHSILSQNEKEMQQLATQMERLEQRGKQNTAQYKRLQQAYRETQQNSQQLRQELQQNTARLKQNQQNVEQLTQSLKLNQMTMNQLRERARQLRTQLDMTSKAANPVQFRKLQTELQRTEVQMAKLLSQTKSTSTFLGMLGANVGSMALWKGISLLTNAIRGALTTQIDFEQQIANLASVLGKSQNEMKALADEAQRLGANSRYTASEIAGLQTELAKLGFSQREIIDSTEAVQAFATATGATLPDAAQTAGAALRAFGMQASEMERLVSAMGDRKSVV